MIPSELTKIFELSLACGILVIVLLIVKEIIRGMIAARAQQQQPDGKSGNQFMEQTSFNCMMTIKADVGKLVSAMEQLVREQSDMRRESRDGFDRIEKIIDKGSDNHS